MKLSKHLLPALSLCFISACTTFEDVHFDHKAAAQVKGLADTNATTSITLTALMPVDEVSKLVDIALANNPGLQQTWLTLKTAEQQVTATSSSQWPSLSAGLNSNKPQSQSASYTASLNVAWTLDIWQQLADATNAEQANVVATAYGYQGARDLLAANVMQHYLALVQSSQLIDIETRRAATLKTNEDIIVDRYRKGLIDLKDLDTAKSSTQSAQASLVDYRAGYRQSLRNLSLLTGMSENKLDYRSDFPAVLMPLEKIDGQNLGRRPDLRQAYQNIVASQFRHKVAYKSLLPGLSLDASLTNTHGNLHDALFGSSAWQLLGQLSAPIFNAGKLSSEVETARLAAEKSYWAFQQTLLTAVNEADNAMAQEQAISKRLTLTEAALASAKRSEVSYTERYRQGTVSLLDLLQIQQQTFSLQANVTQLTYQRLTNRIALGLALGLGV